MQNKRFFFEFHVFLGDNITQTPYTYKYNKYCSQKSIGQSKKSGFTMLFSVPLLEKVGGLAGVP